MKTLRLQLLLVMLLTSLVGTVVQGCFGVRPAGAAATASVGDNLIVPLNRIANAVERIARTMESKP